MARQMPEKKQDERRKQAVARTGRVLTCSQRASGKLSRHDKKNRGTQERGEGWRGIAGGALDQEDVRTMGGRKDIEKESNVEGREVYQTQKMRMAQTRALLRTPTLKEKTRQGLGERPSERGWGHEQPGG